MVNPRCGLCHLGLDTPCSFHSTLRKGGKGSGRV
jgi:hypothetical protein